MEPVTPRVRRAEVEIRVTGGAPQSVILEGDRCILGREGSDGFRYPVAGLSREHLAFERQVDGWMVRDLGSTNGTKLNGTPITTPQLLRSKDVVTAGPVTILFRETVPGETVRPEKDRAAAIPVVFVESSPAAQESRGEATLDRLITSEHEIYSSGHMQALIRAGRELAGNMPLEKLFALIMHLSVDAVGASRGVLMTFEDGDLTVRASKGAGFKISSHVRDQVIRERRSVLVRDALMDQALAARASILDQQIRSMLAVPLQTEDRVIGLIYLDSPFSVHEFTRDDLNMLTVMANIAAIRIENTRLAEVEQAEKLHAKELEHAALIQRSMLPSQFPPFPERKDFALHAMMVPAREVGGDLFDFFLLDEEHLAFAVGDVSGKGAPAALFMAMSRTLLRVTAQLGQPPGKCFTYMNATLGEQNVSGMYITLFYAVLNTRTGELQFGNGGHNPPYVVSAEGAIRPLPQKSGPMLGVWEGFEYQTWTERLAPGESIVLYTDGVIEAVDRNGEFFSEQRLEQFLIASAPETPERLVRNLHAGVQDFAKGTPQADDITVLTLRYLG
jgi:sigma-B regulation protein RsbU (phosphoserine phosphatase)